MISFIVFARFKPNTPKKASSAPKSVEAIKQGDAGEGGEVEAGAEVEEVQEVALGVHEEFPREVHAEFGPGAGACCFGCCPAASPCGLALRDQMGAAAAPICGGGGGCLALLSARGMEAGGTLNFER